MRGHIRIQCARYRLENTLDIGHDIVIPDTQNSIVVLTQPTITRSIGKAVRVLAAVNFDNQTFFSADEIDDVAANSVLSNEFVA